MIKTISKNQRSRSHLLLIPLAIAISLLLINYSGDHLFDKTNNLKLACLQISVMFLSFFALMKAYQESGCLKISTLIFILLPTVSLLPGLFLTDYTFTQVNSLAWMGKVLIGLWCWLLFYFFSTFRIIDKTLLYFSFAILYVCIIAFLEAAGLEPLQRFHINYFDSFNKNNALLEVQGFKFRVESTFGNPNYFAAFLTQLIPLYLAYYLVKAKSIRGNNTVKLLLAVVLLCMFIALMFTGTRAAIAGLGLSLIIFFYSYLKYYKKKKLKFIFSYLVVFGVLSIGLIWLIIPQLFERLAQLIHSSAWLVRVMSWQTAYSSLSSQPFFGHGAGSSFVLFFSFVDPEWRLFAGNRSFNHVHNEWLEVFQEGGILGFSCYIIFWFLVFTKGIKVFIDSSQNEQVRLITLGALCGLLGYHIHGFFSVAERMVAVNVISYLLVAIILSCSLKRPSANVGNLKEPHWKKKVRHFFYHKVNYVNNGKVFLWFLLIVLTLILVKLVPILKQKNAYVDAMLLKDVQHGKLIAQAKDSDDVYSLYEAAKISAILKKQPLLDMYSSKLSLLIPHFRNIDYYSAYSSFLLGDYSEAQQRAFVAQARDNYHQDTINLLTHIAIKNNDEKLLFRQLELFIKLIACKEQIVNCHLAQIKVEKSDVDIAILFEQKHQNEILVKVSNSFLQRLSFILDAPAEQKNALLVSLARNIANQTYFLIKDYNDQQIELSLTLKQTLSNLIKYQRKLAQIKLIEDAQLKQQKVNEIKKEINRLKKELQQDMNIELFIQHRNFLIKLSSWLNTSIEFK